MFGYHAKWIKDYSATIKPLTEARVSFPLPPKAESSFESLRGELLQASLGCIDAYEPFTVECDASDFAIAAVLNQNERPEAKDGSTVRYVGTVQYASIFAKKYGTLVWYACFVMVRVRYVGTVCLFCNSTGTVRWYAV